MVAVVMTSLQAAKGLTSSFSNQTVVKTSLQTFRLMKTSWLWKGTRPSIRLQLPRLTVEQLFLGKTVA